MAKLELWTPQKAKEILSRRLCSAKKAREPWEAIWKNCEKAVYGNRTETDVTAPINSKVDVAYEDNSEESTLANVNYIMRDVRMIHSNLSANPPSVIPRPSSPDYNDRKAADAADRLVRYGMRQYNMPEIFDRSNLTVVIIGSGFVKGIWNPEKGEILDYDEKTGNITLEGDYDCSAVSPWNMYPSPDAENWEDVPWVFERMDMEIEQARYMFDSKEAKEILDNLEKKIQEQLGTKDEDAGKNCIPVYQYWEKGMAYNGMMGRFCWCTDKGELLTPVTTNPHAFKSNKDSNLPGKARLPYNICTDIDKPKTYWGLSVVHYTQELQKVINQIDNVQIDCAKAHGIPRLILPEGTDIKDDSITNSAWDIIKTTGNRDPHFMEPMPLSAVMGNIRNTFASDVMQLDGVNESIYGNQSREQAASLMQYATQQSNMTRKRLFNKYIKQVELVYKDYLSILCEKWTTKRTITVIGKEKAFEVSDIQGSDVSGGYDFVAEYGSSLSLDPVMRREEIMQMMPILEKAGIPMRTILSMLKLNELDRAYDLVQLAEDRQREYFEEMTATGAYIAPGEMEDHKNYLEFAYTYVNTAEYKYLNPLIKPLILQHMKAREALATDAAASAAPPPEAGAAPAPAAPAGGGSLMDILGGG